MNWASDKHLTERFRESLAVVGSAHPRWQLGTTYDGWSEALLKWSDKLVPALVKRFRRCMLAMAGTFEKRHGWIAIAVDGSRLECPRTVANEEQLGCAGKDRTSPQLMLTVAYHLGLGLPWAFRVGPGVESERVHLEQMIEELPQGAMLITDAGFASYALCARMMRENRPFLLRVGGNLRLLKTELPGCGDCTFSNSEHKVWLWPDYQQRQHHPPLELRLIVVGEGKSAVYLLTNVMTEEQLTFTQASELYRMRWGEEVFYRSYKQTMQRSTIRSHAPRNCRAELTWNLLGLWLLGLLSVSRIRRAGYDPLAWSPAASRRVIRDALRGHTSPRGCPTLNDRLSTCLKDTYRRCGPKTTRAWPRQKKHTLPHPPQIRPLTAYEVQLAQRLGIKTSIE